MKRFLGELVDHVTTWVLAAGSGLRQVSDYLTANCDVDDIKKKAMEQTL